MERTKTLYRVIVRTTSSLQPGPTYWQTEVLYCGYDEDEYRAAYHRSRPLDYFRGYGNRCRQTKGQKQG
jgi:hypothetical protein